MNLSRNANGRGSTNVWGTTYNDDIVFTPAKESFLGNIGAPIRVQEDEHMEDEDLHAEEPKFTEDHNAAV